MLAVGLGPVGLVSGLSQGHPDLPAQTLRSFNEGKTWDLHLILSSLSALAMKWDGSGFFPGLCPAQKLWSADLRRVWSVTD